MVNVSLDAFRFVPSLSMSNEFYLTSNFRKKIKTLAGFEKGVHFVTKTYTPAVDRFVSRIAADELYEEAERVALSLREIFSLKSNEYRFEQTTDGVLFECEQCRYYITAKVDRLDLTKSIFVDKFYPQNYSLFSQEVSSIVNCLPFHTYDVCFILDNPIDIEKLILRLEQNPENSQVYIYDYSIEKGELRLSLLQEGIELLFQPEEIRMLFSDKTVLSRYFNKDE